MKRLLLLALALLAVVGLALPAAAQGRGSIVDLLSNDPEGRYTTFVSALEAAGLAETLSGEGDFTVFAPTNDAFDAALPNMGLTIEGLLGDTQTLTTLLNYHIVADDRIFFREMARAGSVTTMQGEDVTFSLEGGIPYVNEAAIVDVDNTADNGVMHGIDGVLIPPSLAGSFAAATPEATVEATAEATAEATVAAIENAAYVRFALLSPDAPNVDIYVNGALSDLQDVGAMTVTDWMPVQSGTLTVGVAETGAALDAALLEPVDVPLAQGSYNTVAIVGSATNGTLLAQPILEDYSPIGDSNARATIVHALEGAQPVDVVVNGAILISRLAYPLTRGDNDGAFVIQVPASPMADIQFIVSGSAALPAGDATAEPISGGTVVLDLPDQELSANTNYFIALSGTQANPQVVVIPVDMATVETGQ